MTMLKEATNENEFLTTINDNSRWTVIHDTINLIVAFIHPPSNLLLLSYSLNFLRVIKLSVFLLSHYIVLVGGWRGVEPNWIIILFLFLNLSLNFDSLCEWKFILFARTFLVFALIKLCFDCHFGVEYVIKADLVEMRWWWMAWKAT